MTECTILMHRTGRFPLNPGEYDQLELFVGKDRLVGIRAAPFELDGGAAHFAIQAMGAADGPAPLWLRDRGTAQQTLSMVLSLLENGWVPFEGGPDLSPELPGHLRGTA